jgi:precorrin-6B C5,15-methyltransferase / cobalt-precorrin-6B C5,C15-methyltransferase
VKKWLTILGMGEDGADGLAARARQALANAEVIVGSERLLGMTPPSRAERQEWPQPFSVVVERILPLRGRQTVILAAGDPLNYGVARKLLDIVPFAEMEIIPHLSAFSMAAARMGWPRPDCDTLSLHGRPAAQIEAFIQPGARLLALTADRTTIVEAARRLVRRGFEASTITVLENMGGSREKRSSFPAHALPTQDFSDLNTIAIECVAGPNAQIYSRSPGLPDEAYIHDGQITKREVRAVTLAALVPAPDALLWDVGAGSGSVAIEWMRSTRGAEAIAFERNQDRIGMIGENADRLGTPRLKIVPGDAPASLAGSPPPDACFIGGGMGTEGVFEACWAALKPRGRIVANVVTLEGELHLADLHAAHGGELARMEVSYLSRIGALRALKPRMAVLQWRAVKR